MRLITANVHRRVKADYETLSQQGEEKEQRMTIEQIIEQRQTEMRALEDASEDIKRYRLLGYQLDRLVEVRDMLRTETEAVKASKPKPTRQLKPQRGSLAEAVARHLAETQAWGLELHDLRSQLETTTARLKRAMTPFIGTVFSFDAMSGLYSLKSREAERLIAVGAQNTKYTPGDGSWLFTPLHSGEIVGVNNG